MLSLIETLIVKKESHKNDKNLQDIIDELIDIINDIKKIKYKVDAQNIIDELQELKCEIKDNDLSHIINTQIRNINNIIDTLEEESPIIDRIKILERNKPKCTNPKCTNLLQVQINAKEYFWSCPDFPKCWGKKKLKNIEYEFIVNGTPIDFHTEKETNKEIIVLEPMDFDENIYSALKKWRLNKSREQALPAYTVCHDSVIEGLSSYIVKNKNELRKIKGIGDKFINMYSDEIFEILIKYYKKKLEQDNTEITNLTICPQCNNNLNKNDNFCSNCGLSLKS